MSRCVTRWSVTLADPLDHHHVGDRWTRLQSLISDRFEKRRLATAISAVGGDQDLRLGIVDAIRQ